MADADDDQEEMKIAFWCGSANPGYRWGDHSYEAGIGGAEECLILLSRELAKLGHAVDVYAFCQEGWRNGVWWYPWDAIHLHEESGYDLIVSWRQPFLLEGQRLAPQQWNWDHNNPIGIHIPTPNQLKTIDKMVFLNNWHQEQYVRVGVPREKCWVGGTAVDTSLFDGPGDRISGRVIAFFHPHRGLDRLLAYWPEIKRRAPFATLAPFWWQEEFHREYFGRVPNTDLGILPFRHLGPRDIATEILQSDVFAYPATGTETAPLTVMKAMCGGAIPCVVPVGGTHATLNGFGVETTQANFAEDLGTLLWRGVQGDEAYEGARYKMMDWARQEYSWEKVARNWTAELERSLS